MNSKVNGVAMRTVSLLIVFLLFGTPAVSHAVEGEPEPVPADVVAWFDRFGASEELWSDFDLPEHREVLGIDQMNEIEVGDPVAIDRWDSSFLRGETDGLDGIFTTDIWIAPVFINGEPSGTVSASRDSPDAAPDFFEGAVPVRDSGSLESIEPDEYLVYEGELSEAWFAVSTDGQIRGVNEAGLSELPEPISLSEYGERSVERYADAFALPGPTDEAGGGTGGAPDDSGPSGVVVAAVSGAAVAAACGAAIVLYRRRQGETRA